MPNRRSVLTGLGAGLTISAFEKRARALDDGSRTPDGARVQDLVRESGPRASAASQRDAASRGSTVVLAIPWAPVKQMLQDLGDLPGKVII